MFKLWYELTSRRESEKCIGYCESHDQALVGDKTIIFRLCDSEMYWSMSKDRESPIIDRGIALHKMIRLMTLSTINGGYLNFMGNEFGHPEWIDFPRAGNNDSGKYARRQWSLVDNPELKYQYLNKFDNAMIRLLTKYPILSGVSELISIHNDNKLLAYKRGGLIFLFNLHGWKTQELTYPGKEAKYRIVLCTSETKFGGKTDNGELGLPVRESCVFFRTFMPRFALLIHVKIVLRDISYSFDSADTGTFSSKYLFNISSFISLL